VTLCDPRDVRCPWETANDILEGLAQTLRASATTVRSNSTSTGFGSAFGAAFGNS
jgi:hypothetical protein